MKTTETSMMMTERQQAAVKAAQGVRDPVEARQAAADVDRIRAENGRRFGDQTIGVAIIRAFRGRLPE